jgi:hypothetical protein
MITTARLRQLRPARISRAAAAATSARKLKSTSIAASHPVSAENATQRRPASQTVASPSSGVPWIGNRPVQFGIAVNRKPVITAGR